MCLHAFAFARSLKQIFAQSKIFLEGLLIDPRLGKHPSTTHLQETVWQTDARIQYCLRNVRLHLGVDCVIPAPSHQSGASLHSDNKNSVPLFVTKADEYSTAFAFAVFFRLKKKDSCCLCYPCFPQRLALKHNRRAGSKTDMQEKPFCIARPSGHWQRHSITLWCCSRAML